MTLRDLTVPQLERCYRRIQASMGNGGRYGWDWPTAHAVWPSKAAALKAIIAEMAPDDTKSLVKIIEQRVLTPERFENGVMAGRTFKKVEEDLGNRAATLAQSRPELSQAIKQTLGALRDELERQNPQQAPELQKINRAFSMWARVRDAAERDAEGRGRFSPSDLLQVLKREAPSRSSFGRGREPMQAFAEAGNEIIGPSLSRRVPETSKSAARMLGDVIGGAVGSVPYVGLMGAQQVPGIGRSLSALGPGAAAEIARRSVRRPAQDQAPQ